MNYYEPTYREEPEPCTCDGGFIYDELGKWVCGKCDEGWIYPTDDQRDNYYEHKAEQKYGSISEWEQG